jgi:glycine/D-amino acid oxidase-like deaminating enzyme
MASNKELIANILAINPSAVTEGLTNAQLSEMVKGLKGSDTAAAQADEDAAAQALADAAAAQALADAAAAQADEDAAAQALADAAAAQADEDAAAQALADAAAAQADEDAAAQALADGDKPFVVAGGKAITSKRGILAEGAEVSASDFSGGDAAFAELCKKGHIVR